MNLTALLGLKPKEETVSELRASLARLEAAHGMAQQRARQLEEARGAVLLDGTAEDIAKHEAELRDVREEAERLAAMLPALPGRIAEAEARDLAAQLDTEAAEAERIAAEAARLVPEYERAAEAALRLAARLNAETARVVANNRRQREHGRERVELPIKRVWPGAELTVLAPMGLPGPRGPCATAEAFATATARARQRPDEAG
jgi:hypothetical protein